MSLLHGLIHRLAVLRRGERYAADQRREMNLHLDLDALNDGGDADTAFRARRTFGNATRYAEETRALTPLAWFDRMRQNIRYAVRGMRRSPGWSAAIIVTVGLGAGLNAAIFSTLDRVLLRAPAGVARPDELRRLYVDPDAGIHNGTSIQELFSYPSYAAMARALGAGHVATFTRADSVRFGDDQAELAQVAWVSPNYFSVLGVRPVVGRLFGAPEESMQTPAYSLVISESLWRRAFGAAPNILGRRLRFGQHTFTIVGVVPGAFSGLDVYAGDAWAPLSSFDVRARPDWYRLPISYFSVVARLPHEMGDAQAESRATAALNAAMTGFWRGGYAAHRVVTGSVIEARGPGAPSREIVLATRIAAVAALVMLLACANVANLLLVRATRRRRELAIRRALGASPARLSEQLLTESVLLALVGGGAAFLFAAWGGTLLRRILFPDIHWATGPVDWPLAGLAVGIAGVVGVVAGAAPALFGSRMAPMDDMRGSAADSHRTPAASALLVAVQAALCVVLLVGAGLFVRSLANVESIDIGFSRDRLVSANLIATPFHHWGAEAIPDLENVAAAMRSVPGVQSAALAVMAPMGGISYLPMVRPNGDTIQTIDGAVPSYNSVTADFFATAGVTPRAGRLLTDADDAASAPVMVVSERMARGLWPGQIPLGQCLILLDTPHVCTTVVGVVSDVHQTYVIDAPAPRLYRPLAQAEGHIAPNVVVRADPARMALVQDALRARMARITGDPRDIQVRTLDQMIEPQFHTWRVGSELFVLFALLAAVLAAIGIYSVVSLAVSQRVREMGIRIALGAQVRDVVDLIALRGMTPVAAGIAAGLAAALMLGRFVRSLLFGVTPADAGVLAGSAAILGAVALLACLIPAWRGARVDPAVTLRAE